MHRTARIARTLALASALGAAACFGGEAVSPQQQQSGQSSPGGRGGGQQAAVPVAVANVEERAMPVAIDSIGTAEAYTNVSIHAQVPGELTSVNFKEGDDVKKGQVLFTLDRRPLEAAEQQSQANLDRDLAQAANARSQAARYQDLAARGIATREQVDQMTSNAAALDATVAADRATLENAKVQLQYATIAAPIAGRTGALMVHAGNLIRANDTTPLVVINQIAPIFVTFAIPEAQLPEFKRYLAQGTVRVQAKAPNETGPPSDGRITFVDNAVDPTTGTIKIKGTFANADRRLWPGLFLNVTVTLTTDPHAIVVPSLAVQTGQQGQYVFVVKPDQTVELRTVAVARANSESTVIKSGLRPGETVVTDGQLRLVPGTRVSVKSGAAQKVAS